MTEQPGKKREFSPEERLVMEGLVHRIMNEAAEGGVDTTILNIAEQIKVDALNNLDPSDEKNKKFLTAIDTVIGFINENPDKSVLDMFKENKKKK